MKRNTEKIQEITIKMGARQGCIRSTVLFNIYVDYAVKEIEEERVEISRNVKVHHFCYSDDTAILVENEEDFNRYLNKLSNSGKKYSIEVKETKIKSMLVRSQGYKTIRIKIGDDRIEQVAKFQHLGVLLDENLNHETDIRCNIARAKESLTRCKKLLSSDLNLDTKKDLCNPRFGASSGMAQNALASLRR